MAKQPQARKQRTSAKGQAKNTPRPALPPKQPAGSEVPAGDVLKAEPGPDGKLRLKSSHTGEFVTFVHQHVQDGLIYGRSIRPDLVQAIESACQYLDDFLAEMAPRNPAERLLATQMLWQHARIGRLVSMAADNMGTTHGLRGFSEAIEAAMNTARRQVLAWAELRAPRPVQYIRKQQVNVAEQQIVSNRDGAGPDCSTAVSSNKQGLSNDVPALPQTQEAVSTVPEWPGSLAGQRETQPAVDAIDRSEDARGQGGGSVQRRQARAARR